MRKQESLEFLDECIEEIKKASNGDIDRLNEIYHNNQLLFQH